MQGLPRRLTRQKLILIAAAAVFLTGVVMPGAATYQRSAAYRSRIVDLRMEAIGELSTQAACFTNVQVISNSREIFGVTVPFTQSKYIYNHVDVSLAAHRRIRKRHTPPWDVPCLFGTKGRALPQHHAGLPGNGQQRALQPGLAGAGHRCQGLEGQIRHKTQID